jgi:hypothetical protein
MNTNMSTKYYFGNVGNDVSNDAHRGFWWVDESVTNHEFLENVILNGSTELIQLKSLFLTCHNVHGQDGQDCAVHGHGHGHFIQWNTREQDLNEHVNNE